MEQLNEIWKDIPNYEGIYQCSNLGRVKSLLKQKVLKSCINSSGYNFVILCNNTKKTFFTIHKLVAICFLQHSPCGFKILVNHIDGDKRNNSIANLELCTPRENVSTCYRKDSNRITSKYVGVSWLKANKKWQSHITINGVFTYLGLFDNEIDASIAYQNKLALL